MSDEAYIVTRRLRLSGALNDDVWDALKAALTDRPGVLSADFRMPGNVIVLVYDVRESRLSELEPLLQSKGVCLRGSVFDKLRRIWVNYQEENARLNANTPDSPCCSKPPPGTGKHK